MLTATELHAVHDFQLSNNLKNESAAIGMILVSYNRLQNVISKLEKEAWEKDTKKKDGTDLKPIIAKDVKKSTVSRVISEKNISGTRKQGGKR